MVVNASTTHHASPSWVGCGGDVVAVESEVGYVGSRAIHLKAVFSISRDHHVIKGPILESVACGSYSRQCAGGEVVVGASASHHAALGWVNGSSNLVAVNLKVGHVSDIFGHGESVGSI